MGRRGPPPKPSKLKKLEGTYRKDRAAKNEVTPDPAMPERPSWLKGEAKAEWDRVVPELAKLEILAKVDASLLAAYCQAHALWVAATKRYEKDGLIIKTEFGPQKHPMIKVAETARAQARLLGAEFGLSAASRSRVSGSGKDEEDESDTFLFGPGERPKVIDGGRK